MTKLEQDPKTKFPDFGSTRIVGWYDNFESAYDAVAENACDINETCYQYALIEECEKGLYHPASKRTFFQYCRHVDHYFQIPEPEYCKHFCGFTIG